MDYIVFPPSSIYTQYPIMTKQKQVFTKELSHLHKYSYPLLSTLLKHLWQRLQPRVFLGMTQHVWHTFICGVSPIILCRSSQAVRLDGECRCTAIFRSLQRCSIRFKSGLSLGHSRIFRDLSRSHYCVVLAVCLGSLSCWKLNLWPSLRSWALWSRFYFDRLSLDPD